MDTNTTLRTASAATEDVSGIHLTDISMMTVEDAIWMAKAQIPFLLALIILCIFIKDDLQEEDNKNEKSTQHQSLDIKNTSSHHGGIFSALGRFLTVIFRRQQSYQAQPKSPIRHPEKSIIDSAMATVILRSIQPDRLIGCSHKMEEYISKEVEKGSEVDEEKVSIDEHSVRTLQSVRNGFNRFSVKQYEVGCKQWNAILKKDTLMRGTTYVPRCDRILHEWNIAAKDDKYHQQDVDWTSCDNRKDQPLEVQLLCPSSLLAAKHRGLKNHNNTFHPCHFDELDLDLTSPDNDHVPIVIYFHGGGYATGTPKDHFVTLLQSAIQYEQSHQLSSSASKSTTAQPPPVLYLSVEYRLAPECPFPGAIIDSLSAVQYILDAFPDNSIHLAGTSAGGGIATVVGFECARMYPDRIKSMALIQPMYNPRCDTESIVQNGPSSIASAEFLQWLWGAYLQTKTSSSSSPYMDALVQHPLFRLGRVGTINPLLRLVWPQVDIPSAELMRKKQDLHQEPKIIISTATADPLRDEGLNLTEGLKDHGCGDTVESLEMKGDHGISILRDSNWRKEFVTRWSACLWPTEESEE